MILRKIKNGMYVLTSIVQVSSLGNNFYNKLKLLFYFTKYYIKRKLHLSPFVGINVNLEILNNPVKVYVNYYTDFWLLNTVFIKNEYKLDFHEQPKTILDIGGNVGYTAIYFALKYPDALIYVFEPNPYAFAVLNKNTSNFSNVRIFNAAVTSKSGEVNFYYTAKRTDLSSIYSYKDAKMTTLDSYSLGDILKICRVEKFDIIKFDAEGSEYEIFKDINICKVARYLIGEVHYNLLPVSSDLFFEIFKGIKLRRFRFSSKYNTEIMEAICH